MCNGEEVASDLRDRISREALCVIRLCRNLKQTISGTKAQQTYLDETSTFLNYISESLTAVEAYLRPLTESELSSVLLKSKLRDCAQLKRSVGWLHAFAKNTVDSHSLAIPFSLCTFLNHLIRNLPGFEKAKLVVLTSPDLNYYKLNLGDFRNLTSSLSQRIDGYPELSRNIGILMFPYCSANEVLVNCILSHEMGHYIFEAKDLDQALQQQISSLWDQFVAKSKFADHLKDPLLSWAYLRNYVRDLLLNWCNEIFADIFATRTLGAAYHFAYLEMERVLPSITQRDRVFSKTHPADDFRFKVHAIWLERCGWADVLRQRTPQIWESLTACKDLSATASSFTVGCKSPLPPEADRLETELHSWMLGVFENLVQIIERYVSDSLVGYGDPIIDFTENGPAVEELLKHGVVPSTLYRKDGSSVHPNPITLLNAGFFFYLTAIQELAARVQSKDSTTDKRLACEQRLNEWLAKAIDDWHIMRREEKP